MHRDRMPHIEPSLGRRLAVWAATGLGVGLVAPAPGTIGGLWGLPLALAVTHLPNVGWQIAAAVALLVAAALICDFAAPALVASDDPQPIVLDEIAVLPLVFLGAPTPTLAMLIVGWLLFRLFDVWKPGPVKKAEQLPGGWGILADDVVAAGLAWAAFRGVLWLGAGSGANWFGPGA